MPLGPRGRKKVGHTINEFKSGELTGHGLKGLMGKINDIYIVHRGLDKNPIAMPRVV